MMETTTLGNNNSTASNDTIAIDTSFNNGYLKSSKNYLPTGTPTNANAFSRPRVIQWDPHMGTDQSTITVVLEQAVSDSSSTPTLNDEIHPMKLVFGRLVVETNQQQQRAPTASPSSTLNSQLVWITLVARVPRFADTQVGNNNQVPLSICVYDNRNSDTATDHWDFGVFTYNNKSGAAALKQDIVAASAGETTNIIEGKKRGAPSSSDDAYTNSKRPNNNNNIEDDQLFNQLLAPFEDSPEKSSDNTAAIHRRSSQSIAPQPSLNYPSNPANAFIQPNPYSNSGSNSNNNNNNSLNEYHHPVNIQPSPMHQLAYDNNAYHNNNRFNNYPSQQQQQQQQQQHHQGYNSSVYPSYSQQNIFNSQPIQTSQLQSQPTQHSMMMPSMSSITKQANVPGAAVGEHPFAGILSKANLKILGDMSEMTYNWSQEEWANGRRLVQFWRKQQAAGETNNNKDNQVECGFQATEQEVYQQQRIRENLAAQKDINSKKPSPLVISCIYWRERNDYYITSVDCIYLLEGLIGVQFTVEEKNRIRRNLEGFRPLTVSKCKPECADFFKLIMSFPHPKPRNIEKDVKVFAWKTLPNALKKIIRKYTPSYSSTAVVNINQ